MAKQDHTNPPVTADSLNTESLVNLIRPLVEMAQEHNLFYCTDAKAAFLAQERVAALLHSMGRVIADFDEPPEADATAA